MSSAVGAAHAAQGSVVGVRAGERGGSGFVALPNGLVVTNLHVVGYAQRAALRLHDGREVSARVAWVDTRLDVALLVPETELGLPPLPPADPSSVRLAMDVSAIGHPLGLDYTVTRGVVSSVDRKILGVTYLQHDAPLNSGNSGGPLIDDSARVLGVNTFDVRHGTSLSFAVPMASLQVPLGQLGGPREQLLRLTPAYRCPECGQPFRPSGGHRCDRCGVALPRFTDGHRSVEVDTLARGAEVVSGLLDALGFSPEEARFGDSTWRVEQEGSEIWVAVDDEDRFVSFSARLVRLPDEGQEAFLRFLLVANDRSLENMKVALRGRIVSLSFVEPLEFLDGETVTRRLAALLRLSASLRGLLGQTFGAPPAPSRIDAQALGLE